MATGFISVIDAPSLPDGGEPFASGAPAALSAQPTGAEAGRNCLPHPFNNLPSTPGISCRRPSLVRGSQSRLVRLKKSMANCLSCFSFPYSNEAPITTSALCPPDCPPDAPISVHPAIIPLIPLAQLEPTPPDSPRPAQQAESEMASACDPTSSWFTLSEDEKISILNCLSWRDLGSFACAAKANKELIDHAHLWDKFGFEDEREAGQFWKNLTHQLTHWDPSDYWLSSFCFVELCRLSSSAKVKKGRVPAIAQLLRLPQTERTPQRLAEAGLLDEQQLKDSEALSKTQKIYLVSDGIILGLMQGLQADLKALSAVPDDYLDKRSDLPPIVKAIRDGRHEVKDHMVQSGLFINILINFKYASFYYQTPLHYVIADEAMTGDEAIAVMQSLLDSGADPNALDSLRCTPLYCAAYKNKIRAVQVLLDKRANPNLQSNSDCTPLHAATPEHSAVMRLLLQHGADPDAQTYAGVAPLHHAASKGASEAVQLLLDYRANPNAWGKANDRQESSTVLDIVNKELGDSSARGGSGGVYQAIRKTLREAGGKTSDELAMNQTVYSQAH